VTQGLTLAASVSERTIVKPLPPGSLVDYRRGEKDAGDPTGDLALNAEMRWEGMADAGYLTPIDRFFVRNHAPTPRVDPATWRLRVEGPGVERTLELDYEDLTRLPDVSVVRALGCAGNGRAFFGERQGKETPGTPWRLGAIGGPGRGHDPGHRHERPAGGGAVERARIPLRRRRGTSGRGTRIGTETLLSNPASRSL
jgi:Oxidoreductase molybdopterin binding domain